MGKVLPGALVFHIIPALWQGCGVGVAASSWQTFHNLLGNESESRHGLAQCLCCPAPAKAWYCSFLHILHLVIHTCLHISFSLGFGRSIVSQLSSFLSSLLHRCFFCSPAPTLGPTVLLFSSTTVTITALPFAKPLKLVVHLSVRFCSAWTGCVLIGLLLFFNFFKNWAFLLLTLLLHPSPTPIHTEKNCLISLFCVLTIATTLVSTNPILLPYLEYT